MSLPILTQIAAERPLTDAEIAEAVVGLLETDRGIQERAAFLRALNVRGETGSELAGFAGHLLSLAVPLTGLPPGTMDVCGTGGDRAGFFNISTAVMFVAAGAGAKVVKHGNRGITSKSGGADVLEHLGVRIDHPPGMAPEILDAAGCCFFFAPAYHPLLKSVAPVRKFLADEGRPSIFNLLGPLLNPARPDFQMVGIYDVSIMTRYSEALSRFGRRRAWVVHGTGPNHLQLDELSTLGPSTIVDCGKTSSLDPTTLGIPLARSEDLLGGEAADNAEFLLALLEGTDTGPRRDIVVLNAAAALVVCEIAHDLPDGMAIASEAIASGAALKTLQTLRSFV